MTSSNLRFSAFIAYTTALLTLITFAIAFFTPPLSGPFCQGGCYEYPYHDIASRFPRDYIWMYPAMILTLLYVVLMAAVHHSAAAEKKLYSSLGFGFSIMAATLLIADYFLQVTIIQPSLLKGETEGIALLSQFNPHGVFIALEEAGYLGMSLSLLCVAPVFSGKGSLRKALRLVLILQFLVAVAALALVSAQYGLEREYIFEIAIISIVWLTLIISGFLMGRVWGRGIAANAAH